ncbi:MAG TPA: hypothetical protein DD670_19225, partial [Planctomycetaceae bacterium]|nr:hypothetical protein [Planctomycetaceae bacterium]
PEAATRADASSVEWMFQATQAQQLRANFLPRPQIVDGKEVVTLTLRETPEAAKAFEAAVKTQPAKYNSSTPFRGVVRLGDKQYGFVFDAADAESKAYTLLYFDANGNGDLTDDGAVESFESKQEKAKAEQEGSETKDDAKKEDVEKKTEVEKPAVSPPASRVRAAGPILLRSGMLGRPGSSPARHRFPRVDMKIAVDGREVEYSVLVSVYSRLQPNMGYAYASFGAGVYYEGEIEVEGRARRAVLVDYNSNGRFDDRTTLRHVGAVGTPQRLYPMSGDVLYLDPKPVANLRTIYGPSGVDFRNGIEKLLALDGRYYDLTVSPSGTELTIEPSTVARGFVRNSAAKYSAVIFGDLGMITINGTGNEPVAVPEGEWRLLSYTIDLTSEKKAEDAAKPQADEPPAAQPGRMVRAGTPKVTRASGAGTTAVRPVRVAKDETVLLPFGPPYTVALNPPVFRPGNDEMVFNLKLTGSGGEPLTSLMVDGARPPEPTIKILDPNGEIVVEGKFKYG